MLTSGLGVLMFLVFLLFAVQVLFGLFASSVVNAVTYDAVRIAAGADAQGNAGARQRAEEHARRLLGSYGPRAKFTWGDPETGDDPDSDSEILTVEVTHPSFLPASMREPLRLDRTTRTIRMRKEQPVTEGE